MPLIAHSLRPLVRLQSRETAGVGSGSGGRMGARKAGGVEGITQRNQCLLWPQPIDPGDRWTRGSLGCTSPSGSFNGN